MAYDLGFEQRRSGHCNDTIAVILSYQARKSIFLDHIVVNGSFCDMLWPQ